MFKKISSEVLVHERDLLRYLAESRFKKGRKGGTFVTGTVEEKYKECFGIYGIILNGGGMIIPEMTLEEVRVEFLSARDEINREVKKERDRYLGKVDTFIRILCLRRRVVVATDEHDIGGSDWWGAFESATADVFGDGDKNKKITYSLRLQSGGYILLKDFLTVSFLGTTKVHVWNLFTIVVFLVLLKEKILTPKRWIEKITN